MKTRLLIAFAVIFTSNFMVAQSGPLDVSFDEDGMVSTEFGSYKSAVRSVALQPDGKILAVGSTYNNGSYHRFALARYNVDGSLDTTFGIEGKVVGDYSEEKMAFTSVLVQPDGKIVAGGIIYNNYNDSQFMLVRFNEDGSQDDSFAENGMMIMDNRTVNAMAMQPDGKIVATGFVYYNDSSNKDFLVMRFDLNGDLDSTFADNGVFITSVGSRDYANSLVIQPDGKIVIAGATFNASHSDFCILRLLSNGASDHTFGLAGMVAIDTDERDEVTSVCIQEDEKIVLSGWTGNIANNYSHAIIRIMPNGVIDSGFATSGMIIGAGSALAKNVKIQPDGKILVAGAYEGGDTGKTAALSRYMTDGSPDTTFGENGLITTSFSSSCQANAVALQADGKILLGGEAGPTGGSYNPDFALLRYNPGSVLSIGDHSITKSSFKVYPNPVTSTFHIDMNLLQSQDLTIELFDMNGRKIHNFGSSSFNAGFNTRSFSLPDSLAAGTYLLNITNNKSTQTIRIIK